MSKRIALKVRMRNHVREAKKREIEMDKLGNFPIKQKIWLFVYMTFSYK